MQEIPTRNLRRRVWDRRTLIEFPTHSLPALIQGFGGTETIAFAAQFAFRGGGAGALLAGARLRQGYGVASAASSDN
jgi:hypothetical protein